MLSAKEVKELYKFANRAKKNDLHFLSEDIKNFAYEQAGIRIHKCGCFDPDTCRGYNYTKQEVCKCKNIAEERKCKKVYCIKFIGKEKENKTIKKVIKLLSKLVDE